MDPKTEMDQLIKGWSNFTAMLDRIPLELLIGWDQELDRAMTMLSTQTPRSKQSEEEERQRFYQWIKTASREIKTELSWRSHYSASS